MADKKDTKTTATAKSTAVTTATTAAPAEKAAEEKKPELVELKAMADQLAMTTRECRVILRKLGIRGDDQKRARWAFAPGDVPEVKAKIKKYQEDKAKLAEERAKAEVASAQKAVADTKAAEEKATGAKK